jgi:hypothetical protein
MSHYCVTFRIADRIIGGQTYSDRRQRLVDNVHTEGQGYWEETTSFLLAESGLNTTSFATKACQGLSANDDLVVVFDPADMSAVFFGPHKHGDVLQGFFTKLQKLP